MNGIPGGTPPPPGGYGPQAQGPTPAFVPPPAVGPWPPPPVVFAPVTHPLAIAALVAGVIQCIPGAGIGALICGFMARSAIRREPYRYTGDVLALVGIVLGGLHVAIGLLYVVGVVALGIVGAVAH